MTADLSRSVRGFILVALVIPAGVTVLALVLQFLALPAVPDPIASHWGADGTANGFASPWMSLLLTVAMGVGLPLVFALLALPGLRRGDSGWAFRFLGAVSLGTSVLIAVLATWTFLMQRGIADAADAPTIGVPLIVSFAAAIAAGAGGWFLQPRHESLAHPLESPPALTLAAGERAVWMRSTSISTPGVVTLVTLTLVIAGAMVVAGIAGETALFWMLTALTLVMVVLLATTTSFHVRVDEKGLAVTSVLGVPRFHVPLADIDSAVSVSVSPLGDFGGWGLRLVPGRFGIVMRTGEAIRVLRRSGRSFVVTVDDAETGAGLLEALVKRSVGAA